MHSIVLGLTLAVSTPDKLASLLPAILFHQTFEGFAVGTQLAAFASPHRTNRRTRGGAATDPVNNDDDDDPSRGSTCCNASPSSTRLILPSPTIPQPRARILWPKILALLFAIPMPLVMIIVLFIRQFQPFPLPTLSSSSYPTSIPSTTTTVPVAGSFTPTNTDTLQGTTCAVSAGLLIFVGLVELVAGQFRYSEAFERESAWKQFGAVGSFIAGSIGMGVIG